MQGNALEEERSERKKARYQSRSKTYGETSHSSKTRKQTHRDAEKAAHQHVKLGIIKGLETMNAPKVGELQAMVQRELAPTQGASVNQVVAQQPKVVVFHPPSAAHFLQSAFPDELALLGDQTVDHLVPVDGGQAGLDGKEFVEVFPLVQLQTRREKRTESVKKKRCSTVHVRALQNIPDNESSLRS
jgi:hypothetical protein